MTSNELGEMFEGDFADTCGNKFPMVSMGGGPKCLPYTDTGARNPSAPADILKNKYRFFCFSDFPVDQGRTTQGQLFQGPLPFLTKVLGCFLL